MMVKMMYKIYIVIQDLNRNDLDDQHEMINTI